MDDMDQILKYAVQTDYFLSGLYIHELAKKYNISEKEITDILMSDWGTEENEETK